MFQVTRPSGERLRLARQRALGESSCIGMSLAKPSQQAAGTQQRWCRGVGTVLTRHRDAKCTPRALLSSFQGPASGERQRETGRYERAESGSRSFAARAQEDFGVAHVCRAIFMCTIGLPTSRSLPSVSHPANSLGSRRDQNTRWTCSATSASRETHTQCSMRWDCC